MDEENNQMTENEAASEPEKSGVSYGGYKYRVAYDKYENKFGKTKGGIRISSIIIGILLFVVFFMLGFLIIRYYNRSVDSYNQASFNAETKPQYTYQSFTYTDG